MSTCQTESETELVPDVLNSTESEAPLDSEPTNSTDLLTTTEAEEELSDAPTTTTVTPNDDETEVVSYKTIAETSTAAQEEEVPTTPEPAPSHSHGVLVQSTILGLFVPVSLRLLSIKLLGVV